MSLFGKSTYSGNNAPVFEGYDCEVNGDLLAIQESYEDQLAVIEGLHALDMEELKFRGDLKSLTESSAADSEVEARVSEYDSVTESLIKNVWEKVKEYLNKIWGKFTAFFHSVKRFFDGLFKSGKDFATKYAEDLKNLKLDGFKYKMFNYENLDGGKQAEIFETSKGALRAEVGDYKVIDSQPSADAVKKVIGDLDNAKEDVMNKVRGKLMDKGSLNSQDYKTALFGYFRGGAKNSDDTKELDVDINSIMSILKESQISTVTDAEKKINDQFTDEIKQITDLEKKYKDAQDDMYKKDSTATQAQKDKQAAIVAAVNKYATAFTEVKSIALEFFREWKSAFTERDRVYKSVCIHALRYKKKK
jgi:hypothetical protein